MRQKFMVIYSHGKRNYSGFAPDVLGCVSVGDTFTEMRSMMKEALEAHLELMAEDGDELPVPATASFDFGEIREESVDYYVVEWLEIEVPEVSLASQGNH